MAGRIEKMSAVDRAWLRMESPQSPMTILGAIELADPIDVGHVAELMRQRLLAHPRFTMRFGRDRLGRLVFEADPDFDIARHVRSIPSPASREDLVAMLGSHAAMLTPGDRPPWEILVVERYGDGALLIPRLHHSIADGVALIQVLVSLCDGRGGVVPVRTAGGSPQRRGLSHLGRVGAAAVRLAALPPDPPSSLKAPLTGDKLVAWSGEYPLHDIKRVATDNGVTINDLVTSAAAGALGRVLAEYGDSDVAAIRAMVPFNLRPPAIGQRLGNRFGLVLPSLPVGERHPQTRLLSVHETMVRLKRRAEAAAAYLVLNVMGFSAAAVEAALLRFFGRKSSLVMTNVPGPADPLFFGDRQIARIMFWVPQAGGIGLGVSIMSYHGAVTVGVVSDRGTLAEPQRLVDAFTAEMEAYGVGPSV